MKKFVLFVALFAFWLGCRSNSDNKYGDVTLKIGLQKSPSNALLILTKLKGYYDSTKVKLEIVPFEAGKLAYQDLTSSASALDLAVAAETPFVLSTLNGKPNISIIGSIVRATNEARLVVVNDGPMNNVPAYFTKKRKIATSLGGSPEYAYWRMLQDYKLDSNKVERVGMKPSEMPAAVGNGVDGVVVFDPAAFKASQKLGKRGTTFVNQQPILTFYNLYAKASSVMQKVPAIEALFVGLVQTQAWMKSNPADAQRLIASYTGIDMQIIVSTWPSYAFSLQAPSKELESLCKDEVIWAKATGKSTVSIINFDAYFNKKVYQRALQQKLVQSN